MSDDIPQDLFRFVNIEDYEEDAITQSRPIGFFEDAMSRFIKNRGSVVCFFIILALILYALLTPLFSPYSISYKDGYYAYVSPKNSLTAPLGFWDGSSKLEVNAQTYQLLSNIPGAIIKDYGTIERLVAKRPQKRYVVKADTYKRVGYVKKLLTKEEWEEAKEWEAKEGIKLFYPVLDQSKVKYAIYKDNMNAWFLTDEKGLATTTAQGGVKDIFLKDANSPDGFSYCIERMNGTQLETRVLYKEWYRYQNGRYASFLFGADGSGYDIFVRLAHGARLSLLLSLAVASINLILGILIGSIEGYYGGNIDLAIERIKDILYDIPYMVIMAFFQLFFAKKLGPVFSMFFAFIFFGWIGTSSTVRAQFYRFKGMDYINASRTLGAKDSRLIFRHILPNAIGFIITTSVLTIPGVIFSEANLTYLGIVNLEGDKITSVGTMLNSAQAALSTYPHCVFFPAAFISILLVCFNEFGNGLRDAFNPSLRGAEDA